MKIRSIGDELFHADGGTDKTKLIATSEMCHPRRVW